MMFGQSRLAQRIEPDAHLLFAEMLADPDRDFLVYTDSQEYADAVTRILEGLYPGASERLTFQVP